MELARLPLRRLASRLAEGIDGTMLVLIVSLSMLGLAALFSASYETPARVVNQLVSLGGRAGRDVDRGAGARADADALRAAGVT